MTHIQPPEHLHAFFTPHGTFHSVTSRPHVRARQIEREHQTIVARVAVQFAEEFLTLEGWRPPERLLICGGSRCGKTTLAREIDLHARSTDVLAAEYEWSQQSEIIAAWLSIPGPWTIEGCAASRGLRKWLAAVDLGKPCDRIVRMTTPMCDRTAKQASMSKAEATIWAGIEPEIKRRGVQIVYV